MKSFHEANECSFFKKNLKNKNTLRSHRNICAVKKSAGNNKEDDSTAIDITAQTAKENDEDTRIEVKKSKQYQQQCVHCTKTFRCRSGLYIHMKTHQMMEETNLREDANIEINTINNTVMEALEDHNRFILPEGMELEEGQVYEVRIVDEAQEGVK